MERIPEYSDFVREHMLTSLAPITLLGSVLVSSGARPDRPPTFSGIDWSDHLMWAVDSAVASARLMLCGQFVGAAAVARSQLERWLIHRAENAGLEQAPGEGTLEFIGRVWSAPDGFTEDWINAGPNAGAILAEAVGETDEPELDHKHVELSDGSEVCPAVVYGFLSELMHGRDLLESLTWEADELLRSDDVPPELGVAVGATADSIALCLREVRFAAATLAALAGNDDLRQLLAAMPDKFSPGEEQPSALTGETGRRAGASAPEAGRLVAPPMSTLMPLLPRQGLSPRATNDVEAMSRVFVATMRGARPAGRLFRDDELTTYAFAWHRARSVATALAALEREREMLGEAFQEDSLTSRGTAWGVLAEAASLLASWLDDPERCAAMLVIGSGIRSTQWLWLEDDDRAMAVLRCVLEQVARSRTWRLKPEKARLLEERSETTPRDWLENAGWRRLSPLNRALGEFAHVRPSSRWNAARELLASLQLDVDEDTAIFTARGAALDFVSMLAAEEVVASMREVSAEVAAAVESGFGELGLLGDGSAQEIEQRFTHIWAQRARALGTGRPWPSAGVVSHAPPV